MGPNPRQIGGKACVPARNAPSGIVLDSGTLCLDGSG